MNILKTAAILLILSAGASEGAGWTLRTRACVDGVEASSDQLVMTVYSAVFFEAGVCREFSPLLSAEFVIANASHEISQGGGGGEEPMGSAEFLPLTLLFQYRPVPGREFEPYLGGGINATVFWEKSGALDSLDFTSCVSPAAQLGLDWNLSDRFLLNLDTRWLWLDTELRDGPGTLAEISMDVFGIALGVGVRL